MNTAPCDADSAVDEPLAVDTPASTVTNAPRPAENAAMRAAGVPLAMAAEWLDGPDGLPRAADPPPPCVTARERKPLTGRSVPPLPPADVSWAACACWRARRLKDTTANAAMTTSATHTATMVPITRVLPPVAPAGALLLLPLLTTAAPPFTALPTSPPAPPPPWLIEGLDAEPGATPSPVYCVVFELSVAVWPWARASDADWAEGTEAEGVGVGVAVGVGVGVGVGVAEPVWDGGCVGPDFEAWSDRERVRWWLLLDDGDADTV